MAVDYKHWGVPSTGTWGAMTEPVGVRTDKALQRVREALAGTLNLLTLSKSFVAPASDRVAARVRSR